MKFFINILLSILSGVLLAVSFPNFNLFYIAWFALIPLLFVVLKTAQSPLKAFGYAFICGFVFYGISMYWLVVMLEFNTGSYFQAAIAAGALWAYLALYFGVWALFLNIIKKRLRAGIFFAVSGGALWVVLEYARTYFLTGFPWNALAYSQHKFLSVAQVAEFTGVYGISFAIVFVNILVYCAIKQKALKYALVGAVFMVFIVSIGILRLNVFDEYYGKKKISVSVVQPNIDQYIKWDMRYQEEIIYTILDLADKVSAHKPDIVVWPETVVPGVVADGSDMIELIGEMAGAAGSLNLIPAPYFDGQRQFNSVFAVYPKEKVFERLHDKTHLVIFGEYVPLREKLSRYFGVLNTLGDFSRGQNYKVFLHTDVIAGSTICSENFFPDITRRLADAGAEIITNHTNDAWFFNTSAPYQHFVMNVFRAIEVRKPVAVSANTGVSAVIDAAGRVLLQTEIGVKTTLTVPVMVNSYASFYAAKGDIFVLLCLCVFILSLFRKRKEENFNKTDEVQNA
jgi:apolipoprotein N-acyltransferase